MISIGKLYDKITLISLINDLCIDYLCVHVCKIAVCFICMHDKRNGIVLVFLIDRKSILDKMQFIVSCIYICHVVKLTVKINVIVRKMSNTIRVIPVSKSLLKCV